MKRLKHADKAAKSLYELGFQRNGHHEISRRERIILEGLREAAGRTRMLKLEIPVPNGNRIYAKCEFDNPTGSHYDRVYPGLIEVLLETGFTADRYGLVETSSGNASVSFSRVCNSFGYDNWVVLPRPSEISETRISLTASEGARIVHPDPAVDGYGLPGIARRMMRLIRESRDRVKPLWTPNHSVVAETLDGIFPLAQEIADGIDKIDYFIGIPGNGTTLYGVGAPLKGAYADMKVIAVEPYSNPGLYLLMNPGMRSAYQSRGELPKIEPSPEEVHAFSIPMPGSGCYGLAEQFPHIRASTGIVDSIRQIDDRDMEWEKPVHKGRSVNDLLEEAHGFRVGITSASSLLVALETAKEVRDRNFVLIFYDLMQGRY